MSESEENSRHFEIEGRRLRYPTEFRDGSSIGGIFVVDAPAANELISDSRFRVAEIAPGRALFALTCVHYTDTDCGVYEEIAHAFFVQPAGTPPPGLSTFRTWADLLRGRIASFTWKLQVTTRLSQQAGLQMWGFPKTIEEIQFDPSGGRDTFTLRMQGQEVLRYSVVSGGAKQPKQIASPVYSIFEGAQHVSHLSQQYRDVGVHPGGGKLRLGDTPLALELRGLGLPRRPLIATWNGHLHFHMSAPRKL